MLLDAFTHLPSHDVERERIAIAPGNHLFRREATFDPMTQCCRLLCCRTTGVVSIRIGFSQRARVSSNSVDGCEAIARSWTADSVPLRLCQIFRATPAQAVSSAQSSRRHGSVQRLRRIGTGCPGCDRAAWHAQYLRPPGPSATSRRYIMALPLRMAPFRAPSRRASSSKNQHAGQLDDAQSRMHHTRNTVDITSPGDSLEPGRDLTIAPARARSPA